MTTSHLDIPEEGVLDETADSDNQLDYPTIQPYRISFFGADYPVDALYKRLKSGDDATEGDIYVPDFQRGYVWTKRQADSFIESLLLGLPVPGIFLSTESDTSRRLVIDGGQRLRTIKSYMDDNFRGGSFRLGKSVHKDFAGLRYQDLSQNDRRRLDDAIIHATIVKQDGPNDGDRSLFYLFERLNTGGTPASPHEVRRALWGGSFNDLLVKLADNEDWQSIYGKRTSRFKDQELILRFFAFYVDEESYSTGNTRTMRDFLSSFMAHHRNIDTAVSERWAGAFEEIIGLVNRTWGMRAFRIGSQLNAAVFDSVSVALARALDSDDLPSPEQLQTGYDSLLLDSEFQEAVGSGTSHVANVQKRMELARNAICPA